jgi:hypothetical protein
LSSGARRRAPSAPAVTVDALATGVERADHQEPSDEAADVREERDAAGGSRA